MEEHLWNTFTRNGKVSAFLEYRTYVNKNKLKDNLYKNNNTNNNDNNID